jgi:release factor glutamine methyltransferase
MPPHIPADTPPGVPADPAPLSAAVTACAAALLRGCPLAPLEARILLAHALGWRRTELITRADEALSADAASRFAALVARRVGGEPIAYLVGEREFFGLALDVTPDVLIPRPETELLVELTLQTVAAPASRVLDLGTGSGAIALAIAAQRPDVAVVATDRSPAALALAARNGARLLPATRPGGPVQWFAGDWFDALPPGLARFHVIASNPPYIADGDAHLATGDLRFEPRGALTDDADGLQALAAIAAGAAPWLLRGGTLWLEHGYDQASAVRALLVSHGFEQVATRTDLAGIERVTGGIRYH